MEKHKRKFTETVRGKIVVSFVFILVALVLTFFINRVAFQRITSIIDELSMPNEKLISLTRLHRDVSDLMDLQRIEAMGDKREPSEMFVRETENVEASLDTLRILFGTQSSQLKRINSIDSLMSLRNKLFLKYLKVRYNYVKKGVLDKQLDALSSQIDKENLQVDSNVVTTQKSFKTTTIIPGEPQNAPKKRRWFSKKPKENPTLAKPQVIIEEKTDVQVDTLAVASRDSILSRIENSISSIETDRNQSRKYLKGKEMDLMRTNDLLIAELLSVIREVESQEMAQAKARNKETIELANQTIGFTRIITIVFVLAALILAGLIIADVARSNKYRAELEQAKAEAEYHSIAKQRFLANMSHEIRTPLQSIIGYSEQLSQTNQDENTAAITGSAKHLLQVVNEILDYSRIISGKFTFENEPFNLKETVQEVLKTIGLQAENKGLSLIFTLPEEEIILLGDAFRLRQILYNLLGNAVKFTKEGKVSLHVKAVPKGKHFYLEFEVEDSGPGLKPNDLSRIFNQFEQARNENVQSGTGLGLSIVKELVEAQGGKIDVESEFGKGARFIFSIHYRIPDAIQVSALSQEMPPLDFKGKVWVVDDDELILKLCAIILKKHQIAFDCFDSAEKLLAADWDPEVQIIFADVRLPGMNGIELTSALKQRKLGIPVIALTAQVLPEEKQHLLQGGYDDLLLKPFTESQLLDKLRRDVPSSEIPETDNSYDFSSLRQMIPDPEELQAIILQFKSDTRSDLQDLQNVLKAKDSIQTVLLVHRIAGRTGQMGETATAREWRAMELKLRNNESGLEMEIVKLVENLWLKLEINQ